MANGRQSIAGDGGRGEEEEEDGGKALRELRTAYCGRRIADGVLRTANCGRRIADRDLRTGRFLAY